MRVYVYMYICIYSSTTPSALSLLWAIKVEGLSPCRCCCLCCCSTATCHAGSLRTSGRNTAEPERPSRRPVARSHRLCTGRAAPGTANAAAVGHRGAAPAIAAAVAPLDCRPPRTGPRRASFFLTRTIASAIFLRQVQRGSTITARTTETIAMLAPAAVARAPATSRLTDGRAAGFRSLFAHGSAVAFLALTCTAVAFLILACIVHTRAMVSTSIHIRTYARDVEAEHQR